jgi:hypothetical protein
MLAITWLTPEKAMNDGGDLEQRLSVRVVNTTFDAISPYRLALLSVKPFSVERNAFVAVPGLERKRNHSSGSVLRRPRAVSKSIRIQPAAR